MIKRGVKGNFFQKVPLILLPQLHFKAELTTDQDDFIEKLRQPGFWNNGIDGAVGIEVLSFVAEALGQPILVLTQEPNGQYRYWISGTQENPRNSNLWFNNITVENPMQMSIEEKIEEILNAYPNAIKLFHNGIHFQAILKK